MEAKSRRHEELKAWQQKKEDQRMGSSGEKNKNKLPNRTTAPLKEVPRFMQPTKSSLIRTGKSNPSSLTQSKKTTKTVLTKPTGASFASPNAKFTFKKSVPNSKKVPNPKAADAIKIRKDENSNPSDKSHVFVPVRVQTKVKTEKPYRKDFKSQPDVKPKRPATGVKRDGSDKTLDFKQKQKPATKITKRIPPKEKIAALQVSDAAAIVPTTVVRSDVIPDKVNEIVEKLPLSMKPVAEAEDSGVVTDTIERTDDESTDVRRSLGGKVPIEENVPVENNVEEKWELQTGGVVTTEQPEEIEVDVIEMNKENIPPLEPVPDLSNELLAPPTNTVEVGNEEAPGNTVKAEKVATFLQPPKNEFQYVIDPDLKTEDGRVKDVPYFKSLVTDNADLLEKLASKWDEINNSTEISEDVQGEIRSVSCKARLIISQKFTHFSELIYNCEYGVINEGEGATLVSDLDGFWTMIFIQVEQVLGNFNNLVKIRERGWKLDEPEIPVEIKPVVGKPKKVIKKTVKKGPSKFAQFLAAKRNVETVKPEEDPMVQNDTEKSVMTTPPKTPLQVERTESVRRSARIANRSVKKLLEMKPIDDDEPVDSTKIKLEFNEDEENQVQTTLKPDIANASPQFTQYHTTPATTDSDKTAEYVRIESIRRSTRIASKQNSTVTDEVLENEKEKDITEKAEFDFKALPHSNTFSPCSILPSQRSPSSPYITDLAPYLGCHSPLSGPPSRRVSFVRLQKSCSPSPNLAGAMMRAARIGKTSNQDRRETLYKSLLLNQRVKTSAPNSPSVINTPTDLFNKMSLNTPQTTMQSKLVFQSQTRSATSTLQQTTDDLLVFSPL